MVGSGLDSDFFDQKENEHMRWNNTHHHSKEHKLKSLFLPLPTEGCQGSFVKWEPNCSKSPGIVFGNDIYFLLVGY